MIFPRARGVATLMAGGAAAAAFSPSDVSGLEAWYDFSDISTLYQDSGKSTPVASDNDPIGAAVDQGSGGYDIIQATADNRPTYKTNIKNGLSVASFDGSNDTLDYSSNVNTGTDMTVFIVCVRDANGGALNASPWGRNTNNYFRFLDTAGAIRYYYNNTAVVDTSVAHNVWRIYTLYHKSNVSNQYFNGVISAGSPATPADASMNLPINVGAGRGYYLNGDVGEVIMYSAGLSDTDRLLVENYLNTKWGVY